MRDLLFGADLKMRFLHFCSVWTAGGGAFAIAFALWSGTIPRAHAQRPSQEFRPPERRASPVRIRETTRQILNDCKISDGSRFDDVLKSLRSAGQKDCKGLKESSNRIQATRELLYELRKVRESELYQIEALNALMYDPEFKAGSPSDLEKRLLKHMCDRSNTAVRDEINLAIRKKTLIVPKSASQKDFVSGLMATRNPCHDPKSEVAGLIQSGVKAAVADFTKKQLRQPEDRDLRELNSNLEALRKSCAPFFSGKTKEDLLRARLLSTELKADRVQVSGRSNHERQVEKLQKDARMKKNAERKAQYQKEVFPIVVKLFTSPYGRLLADSRYLQRIIGLDLNANWEGPEFCKHLPQTGTALTHEDINTGYFGSPTRNIDGIKAVTRKNIGELSTTRIPELRERFWTPFREAAFLQGEEAQVQQQVAYELLYNHSSPRIKEIIAKNPLYATLACESIRHESFWEQEDIREAMEWGKGIAMYGGIGAGLVGGFFSGGAGWAVAASLSAGLGMGIAGTTLDTKQGLDQKKVETMASIQEVQNALVNQAGVRDAGGSGASGRSRAAVRKLSTAEQKQVDQYEKKFQEALAGRTIESGKVISGGRSPSDLKEELLRTAKDDRERYLINIAYDLAVTVGTVGLGKGLSALRGMAKARNLDRLEKIAELGVKLENKDIAPSDIADAFGSCLVLDNCSGVGVLTGAAMKKGTASLKGLYASLRKNPVNSGKSDEELFGEIADAIAARSEGKVDRAEILATLRTRLAGSPRSGNQLSGAAKTWSLPEWMRVARYFDPKYSKRKKLFQEYPLLAKNVKDVTVLDQGQSGTCALHAMCQMLSMTGAFPKGKTIDLEYVDGLRVWERMNDLILKNPGPSAADVSKVLGQGNYSSDVLDLFASRAVPYINIKDASKDRKMFAPEQREALKKELAELVSSDRNVREKQLKLNEIMKRYYGEMRVNREISRELRKKQFGIFQQSSADGGSGRKATIWELKSPTLTGRERLEWIVSQIDVDANGKVLVQDGNVQVGLENIDPKSSAYDPNLLKPELQKFVDGMRPASFGDVTGNHLIYLKEGNSFRIFEGQADGWGTIRDSRGNPVQLKDLYSPGDQLSDLTVVKMVQPGVDIPLPMRSKNVTSLNFGQISANIETIESKVVNQLKNGSPVYIALHGGVDYMVKGVIAPKVAPDDSGAHAMVVVGAKQNPDGSLKELLLLNSWGGEKGQHGFYSLPWTPDLQSKISEIVIMGPGVDAAPAGGGSNAKSMLTQTRAPVRMGRSTPPRSGPTGVPLPRSAKRTVRLEKPKKGDFFEHPDIEYHQVLWRNLPDSDPLKKRFKMLEERKVVVVEFTDPKNPEREGLHLGRKAMYGPDGRYQGDFEVIAFNADAYADPMKLRWKLLHEQGHLGKNTKGKKRFDFAYGDTLPVGDNAKLAVSEKLKGYHEGFNADEAIQYMREGFLSLDVNQMRVLKESPKSSLKEVFGDRYQEHLEDSKFLFEMAEEFATFEKDKFGDLAYDAASYAGAKKILGALGENGGFKMAIENGAEHWEKSFVIDPAKHPGMPTSPEALKALREEMDQLHATKKRELISESEKVHTPSQVAQEHNLSQLEEQAWEQVEQELAKKHPWLNDFNQRLVDDLEERSLRFAKAQEEISKMNKIIAGIMSRGKVTLEEYRQLTQAYAEGMKAIPQKTDMKPKAPK